MARILAYPNNRILKYTSPNLPVNITTPISRWKLDGNGDDSIGSNNASVVSNITWTYGKLNKCAYFDGTVTTNLEVPSSTTTFNFIQNTGIFTINFWMRTDNPSDPFSYVMGNIISTNGFYIEFYLGEIYMYVGRGSGLFYFLSGGSVCTDTKWNMYTITGDASNVKFYKNAVLSNSTSPISILATGASETNLSLSSANNTGNLAKAHYKDDIAIWNSPLSSTDITNLYNYYTSGKILLN